MGTYAYCLKCGSCLWRREDACKECPECGEEPFHTPEEILSFRIDDLEEKVEELENKLNSLNCNKGKDLK